MGKRKAIKANSKKEKKRFLGWLKERTLDEADRNTHESDGDSSIMDAEAAEHLNEMVKTYEAEYPGHTFTTFSWYEGL